MELMDDIQSKWCGQKKNESFLSAEEGFRVEEQEEGQAEQCESNYGAQFGLCPCFWFKVWMLIDAEGQKSNNDSKQAFYENTDGVPAVAGNAHMR